MSDVICVVVTELPELPEPTVNLVFPERTANPGLPERKAQRALPEPRVLPAARALMELRADAELPGRRALKVRPALREPKAPKVDPETANSSRKSLGTARHKGEGSMRIRKHNL